MQPVRVFSPELELLGEVDSYTSLRFVRRYYTAGEFELHIELDATNADQLQQLNLIMLGNDPRKAGIVLHRQLLLDKEGQETLMIKGITLDGVIGWRITIPPIGYGYDALTGNAETVMKHYVQVNAVSPIDARRVIPMLAIAPEQERGRRMHWQSRYKPLDDELAAIGAYAGLGWEVALDLEAKQWVFDVLEGRNLTEGQVERSGVVFSVDFDNIRGQQYVTSLIGHKNAGYVAGQGEMEERKVLEVGGGQEGLGRYETFIDARDIGTPNGDMPPTEAEVEAMLVVRGEQKLDEMAAVNAFEAQVMPSGSFVYGVNWDLGDIATVRNSKWGVTMNARITELAEVYEPNGFTLSATFGNSLPTLIDRLKRELGQVQQEVRR